MFSLFTTTPPAFRDDVCVDGPTVRLRPLSVADADAMFAYASDPEVTRFLPWQPAPDAVSVRPFLHDQVNRRKRCESLGFAIVLRESGEMIGSTDLMDLRAVRGQAELGYLIAQSYWGRGLMTEAAAMSRDYAFGAMNLQNLIAFADADNVGSRRVLEKLGMRHVSSETRTVKGEERPYVRYEITRADWEERAKI
jgi:ribosomal-protein-alanine N-acetyltransferase